MGRLKWMGVLMGALLSAALLTGCVGQSTEELYALPKQPDEYYELQNAIDQLLTVNASYSGPLSGSNQQAVQLADLDGDAEDEAIVFIKTAGERPLKAYIFDETENGKYLNTGVIEGDGSAFDAVDYVQLDGEPGMEILLGRQLSEQITQSLCAYTYKDGHLTELMSTNYAEYTVADLDGDDRRDVFVLRSPTEERAAVAELYRCVDGQMEREPEVQLSDGAKEIRRIVTGYVAQGIPAVFVASEYGENMIITDIFAFAGKDFRNISTNAETGLSAQTVRSYNVYASDIDSDGLIELPSPVALPSQSNEATYWVIDWYNLMPDGRRDVKTTTFHNYMSGWYLELPEHWHDHLTIMREEDSNGDRGYTFAKWNGREQEPDAIVTIRAFAGEDRLERASADGNFLLAEKGEIAYAASLGDCAWAKQLTQEDLRAMFRFIEVDWNTGEI